jgi:superoxide dismutase, Cu-Zn family
MRSLRVRYVPVIPIPLALLALPLLFLGACQPTEERPVPVANGEAHEEASVTATAHIEPIRGGNASGHLTLTQENNRVRIEGQISGLSPNGRHGFHVHEGTSCDAPGDHFSPHGRPHGGPDDPAEERHKGDLGNITSDGDGVAQVRISDDVLAMRGENSIIGRVIVVHESDDDMETQPSGDAGDPIGCGVIELAGQGSAQPGPTQRY